MRCACGRLTAAIVDGLEVCSKCASIKLGVQLGYEVCRVWYQDFFSTTIPSYEVREIYKQKTERILDYHEQQQQ